MFKNFLFSLSLKYFIKKKDTGSVYLAGGMTCAKALRQELFPSEEASEGLAFALEATPLPLCLKICFQLPLRPRERSLERRSRSPGCQLEDSVMVGEIGPSGAVPV